MGNKYNFCTYAKKILIEKKKQLSVKKYILNFYYPNSYPLNCKQQEQSLGLWFILRTMGNLGVKKLRKNKKKKK